MSWISLFRGARAAGLAAAMIAAGCLWSAAADAQTTHTVQAPATSSNQSASGEALPVGRVIYAELMQNIDVRKVKPGDRVFARTTLAVLARGKVLIAEGAKITGHVTEAKTRSKDDAESVLGIVFDHAETVDGKELPLNTTVQAIGIGELRAASALQATDEHTYSAVPGPFSIEDTKPTQRDNDKDLPKAETSPALDIGSKGVIGVKAMELTEATDATHGSLVRSLVKNVKLDNRWQLVLRVIAPKVSSAKTDEK